MPEEIKAWMLSLASMLRQRASDSQVATGRQTGIRYVMLTDLEALQIASQATELVRGTPECIRGTPLWVLAGPV